VAIAWVVERSDTKWLCWWPVSPGPYSAREARGENRNYVTSAISRSHPCTCPCDFRVRLCGRSEEGPTLPHVPSRKKNPAAGHPIPVTTRSGIRPTRTSPNEDQATTETVRSTEGKENRYSGLGGKGTVTILEQRHGDHVCVGSCCSLCRVRFHGLRIS